MSRGIRQKLATLGWYLKRPKLLPPLCRSLTARLLAPPPSPAAHRAAEAWCASRAIPVAAALEQITGRGDRQPIRERFAAEFALAAAAVRSCPVQMGGAGELDLLYWIAEHIRARRVIETGVAYGWSSLALLLSLTTRPDARLVSTDMPYRLPDSESHVGCAVPAHLRAQWRILTWADREALPRALRQLPEIDLCHYDSDKSQDRRRWSYPRLWNALRAGGYFVSDDVGDNLVFREFADGVGVEPLIVATRTGKGRKYVGILRKP